MTNPLAAYLDPLPLIAVLRGITPDEIPAIGAALVAEGFRILEVPLNSPQPFESIRALAAAVRRPLPRRRRDRARRGGRDAGERRRRPPRS